MDPRKAAAEWLYHNVFRSEPIRPKPAQDTDRIPPLLRAARSLEKGIHPSWQSQKALFLKQAKLLANYEDNFEEYADAVTYYPTYQSLTDRQLRSYFSWRTKLRRGDLGRTSLSYAFLYIYELLNQIGAADPGDGYRKLTVFRDAYGPMDGGILPYLDRWLTDYVIYYGLDRELLSATPRVIQDRSITVLEHIQEQEEGKVVYAVKQLSKWLGRSKFYAAYQEDMDRVIVRVLRRFSAHYAARCKKTMTEQLFGSCSWEPAQLFDAAVFCDPLKRKNYQYAVDERYVYSCKNGLWSVWRRAGSRSVSGKLDDVLKTIDALMRQAFHDCRPIKLELDTKWLLRLIQEEIQGLLAEKTANQEKKIAIDYAQLTQIRQDAAMTREKLIVEEEMDDIPQQTVLQEPEPPAPAGEPGGTGECPLSPAEYRLLQCLLYGGDTGWVQGSGQLLSVLVDGINEKLYDTFMDTILDDTPRLIEDYIDDLKEMVYP